MRAVGARYARSDHRRDVPVDASRDPHRPADGDDVAGGPPGDPHRSVERHHVPCRLTDRHDGPTGDHDQVVAVGARAAGAGAEDEQRDNGEQDGADRGHLDAPCEGTPSRPTHPRAGAMGPTRPDRRSGARVEQQLAGRAALGRSTWRAGGLGERIGRADDRSQLAARGAREQLRQRLLDHVAAAAGSA